MRVVREWLGIDDVARREKSQNVYPDFAGLGQSMEQESRAVFASNNGSHPVFRGVAIMRRIACLPIPDPGSLGIVVSFPATNPRKTTGARFEAPHWGNSGPTTEYQ